MIFDDFFIPPIISGIFIDEIKMSLPKDEIKNGNINDAVPLIAIERHRLLTDGEGITTLVGFQGCPLRCKYCINKQCWEQNVTAYYTPEQLYEEVKKIIYISFIHTVV